MRVTKIGHATMLIQFGKTTILTDPWMTHEPILGLIIHRDEQLGMEIADLPPIDLILISHDHEDHFEPATMRQLDKASKLLCPKGEAEAKAKKLGFKDAEGLEPGDVRVIGELTITATHASHPENQIGFVLESGDETLYFAGDTSMDERLLCLGERHVIDCAILPVSGDRYPLLTRDNLDPDQAAELAHRIGARITIPTDYDLALKARFSDEKFRSSDQPVEEFIAAMAARHPHGEVVILEAGDTWMLG